MTVTYQQNRTIGRFDDVQSFLDYVLSGNLANPENALAAAYWLNKKARDENISWMGFDHDDVRAGETCVQTAKRLINEGWKRGGTMFDNMASAFTNTPTPTSIRRRVRWNDSGDEVDMQAVYGGNLDRAWRRPMRVPTFGPQRIRIVVDALSGCWVDATAMAWRGVAAVSLCDTLTAAGYSVELVSAWTGTAQACRSHVVELGVVTKAYSAPVDITTLLACNAMPAFFRALGHLFQPVAAKYLVGRGDGYYVKEVEVDSYTEDDTMLFVTPHNMSGAEQAREWVTTCIEDVELARDPQRAGDIVAA